MTELTLEELEEKFDEIFERVDEGEKFLIRSDIGDAVLVPYYDYESNMSEINYMSNHNDGC